MNHQNTNTKYVQYIRNNTMKGMPEAKQFDPESEYTTAVIM
jgi:hypothetical protein